MNMADSSYLGVARKILQEGEWKNNRTGIRTKVIPFQHFQHNMATGFPLLTTKKMGLKNIAAELEFFIKGLTDKRWLEERKCMIWSEWCNPSQKPKSIVTKEQELVWQRENPDLGPLGYSHNWRNFNGDYTPIPFIYTELDKTIKVDNTRPDDLLGKEFDGKYGKYTVVSYNGKDKHHNKRFSVKFHKTGFVKDNLNKKQIEDNNVWDAYYPAICDVACVGEYSYFKGTMDKTIVDKLMLCWRAMIHRCYDKNNHAYKNYGAKGIYVSNRWLIFENYLNDIQKLDGWQSKLDNWRDYQLDKDINGGKCYSRENCIWVSLSDNSNCTAQNYYFDAVSPDGTEYKNIIGLNRFCKKYNLKTKVVEASISVNCNTHNGWRFTRKENLKSDKYVGIDQLKIIVDKLKSNPDDRRMICSGLNPLQINEMALPPCHYSWNVVHINGKLNLHVNIRSQDVFLGMPYNIASYALLLLLLCKESGLTPGILSILSADCHIYENHMEQMEEQIGREPYESPQVEILDRDGKFSIFDWQYTDFKLTNYNSHPAIKGEVAI